jgi:mono/diheme cytochrome c family protein
MKQAFQQMVLVLGLGLFLVSVVHGSDTAPASAMQTNGGTAPSAASVFATSCAKCHGKDGHPRSFKAKLIKTRNLTDGTWQDSVSDERLFNSIQNGREKMPAFGKKLSIEKVESLVDYVRTFRK